MAARRENDDALKAAPEAKGNPEKVVARGPAYCNRLFAIERELNEAAPEERHKASAERSLPVLFTYYAWRAAEIPDDARKLDPGRLLTA